MIYATAIHGDEPIPVFTLAFMGIKQIVCNYSALIKNKRFLEKDLNQSFGTKGNSTEEIRAKEILKKIPKSEVVIDFHTMSAKSDPFVIIVDLKMLPLAIKTGLKHIVYMKYNIKSGCSLIDHRRGISVEVGQHNSDLSIKTIKKIITNLKSPKITNNFTVYEVYEKISKKGNYQNFKVNSEGFIPVLAGEKSYNFYGLKSKIINI